MDTTNEKQRAKNLTSLNIIALLIAILPFQLTWITYAAGIYFPLSWLLQLLEAFATGMVIVYAYHREWMYVIIYGVSSTVGRILLCLVQLSMGYYFSGWNIIDLVAGAAVAGALFLEEEYLQENSSQIFIMTGSSIVLSLLTQWISIFRILFFYIYSIGITSFSPSLDMLIILGVVLMFLEESDTFYSIFWGKTEQPGWMRQRQIRTYRNSGSVAVQGTGNGLAVIGGNLFLAFAILYSLLLVYDIFSGFSIFKIFFSIFSILTCAGIWMAYSSVKTNSPSSAGFTMVFVIMIIKIVGITLLGLAVTVGGAIAWAAYDTGIAIGWAIGCLVVVLITLAYYVTLGKTVEDLSKAAKGGRNGISTYIYSMVGLGFLAFRKLLTLIWSLALAATARGITNGMYGYGNDFSSYIEQLFEEAGLGYSYGYRASSSLTQSMIRPLADWIQKTLGLSTNPLILIAAVAMPILEIIILVQIRAAENRR